MKKFMIAATLASLAMAASADDQVGKLSAVKGNVTVSSGGQVVKGVNGTPLSATSTILVANGAKATVMLNEGCVIPLKANQHLVLSPKLTCSQQYASVNQLFTPYQVAQAPVGGAAAGGGFGAAAAGLSPLIVSGAIVITGAVAIEKIGPSGS